MTDRTALANAGNLEELRHLLDPLEFMAGWNKHEPSLWKEPRTSFVPMIWHYADAKPGLDAAGRLINAEQAERWGFVNRVVEFDDLLPAALSLAKRIAANPPLGVQTSKELALRAQDMPIEQGLRMESMLSHIARQTEDAQEGPRAYAEKRKPVFKGR